MNVFVLPRQMLLLPYAMYHFGLRFSSPCHLYWFSSFVAFWHNKCSIKVTWETIYYQLMYANHTCTSTIIQYTRNDIIIMRFCCDYRVSHHLPWNAMWYSNQYPTIWPNAFRTILWNTLVIGPGRQYSPIQSYSVQNELVIYTFVCVFPIELNWMGNC